MGAFFVVRRTEPELHSWFFLFFWTTVGCWLQEQRCMTRPQVLLATTAEHTSLCWSVYCIFPCSRVPLPAVGCLPVLRREDSAVCVPRAPLHGHCRSQRTHPLSHFLRHQVLLILYQVCEPLWLGEQLDSNGSLPIKCKEKNKTMLSFYMEGVQGVGDKGLTNCFLSVWQQKPSTAQLFSNTVAVLLILSIWLTQSSCELLNLYVGLTFICLKKFQQKFLIVCALSIFYL